jgi:uncharacterized protein (TIRG00374 family)
MQKYIKYSVIVFILIFAAISIMAIITDSFKVLLDADPFFFTIAALFFMLSIVFWVIPWSHLIKKQVSFTYLEGIIVGISCVYGALTPIQVGAEALRSIKAKDIWNVRYSDSVSASMLVKGIKFLFLAILSSVVLISILLGTELSFVMVLGLISGFLIILIATIFFLLPINKKAAILINKFFNKISKKIKKFKVIKNYFEHYSKYLSKVPKRRFALVFFFSAISFVFEFLSLMFVFFSLNVLIDFFPLVILFIIISVLERTPILPRGVGLVEAAGFVFLSIPEFSSVELAIAEIAAILILFNVVRLIIPTIVSLMFAGIKIKKHPTKN